MMSLEVNVSPKTEPVSREETRALLDAYLTKLNSLRHQSSLEVSAKEEYKSLQEKDGERLKKLMSSVYAKEEIDKKSKEVKKEAAAMPLLAKLSHATRHVDMDPGNIAGKVFVPAFFAGVAGLAVASPDITMGMAGIVNISSAVALTVGAGILAHKIERSEGDKYGNLRRDKAFLQHLKNEILKKENENAKGQKSEEKRTVPLAVKLKAQAAQR